MNLFVLSWTLNALSVGDPEVRHPGNVEGGLETTFVTLPITGNKISACAKTKGKGVELVGGTSTLLGDVVGLGVAST
jgi:hypothetical protein